jgi:signal transduction histidine kinase
LRECIDQLSQKIISLFQVDISCSIDWFSRRLHIGSKCGGHNSSRRVCDGSGGKCRRLALSRRKHGFYSRRARQLFQRLSNKFASRSADVSNFSPIAGASKPAAGEADLFPQEITRALLNLINNGFYAATKRKAEANGGDYEPTLAAATKNLGDRVEIRIRDNGTGIPPEVKEKLFNPFFTTKPAGEGTGLGLSISHDIVVKQHGGSIEVDTQPGEFTEVRIILLRTASFITVSQGRA